MKNTNKIMAMAITLAVGLSTAHAAEENSPWWTVNFDTDYTNGGLITNSTSTDGDWTSSGADASIMTNVTIATKGGNKAKLDTQVGSLIWTPTSDLTCKKVLVDADIYLVGSDEAPNTNVTDVQTEVYLSTAGTSTNLYAHVRHIAGGTNYWQKLSGTVLDKSWVKLQIKMDYSTSLPKISILVEGLALTGVGGPGAGSTAFDVMNKKDGLSSVSFVGTGYFDNFVGTKVKEVVSAPTFTTGSNTNGFSGAAAGSYTAVGDDGVNATFTNIVAGVGNLKYVKLTQTLNGTRVRTARVTVSGAGNTSVVFDNLPPGTYEIVGYYGNAPTVIPSGYKPEAEAAGANKAAEVEDNALKISVIPTSGLYYTLFAGESPSSLSKAGDSVLATPAHEDSGALQIQMPLPTDPNEVKIIKIYASDAAY